MLAAHRAAVRGGLLEPGGAASQHGDPDNLQTAETSTMAHNMAYTKAPPHAAVSTGNLSAGEPRAGAEDPAPAVHAMDMLATAEKAIPMSYGRITAVSTPVYERLSDLRKSLDPNVLSALAPATVLRAIDETIATPGPDYARASVVTDVVAMLGTPASRQYGRFIRDTNTTDAQAALAGCRMADVTNACLKVLDTPEIMARCGVMTVAGQNLVIVGSASDKAVGPPGAASHRVIVAQDVAESIGRALGIKPADAATMAADMRSMFEYLATMSQPSSGSVESWTGAMRQGILALQRRMESLRPYVPGYHAAGTRAIRGLHAWIDKNADALAAMNHTLTMVDTETLHVAAPPIATLPAVAPATVAPAQGLVPSDVVIAERPLNESIDYNYGSPVVNRIVPPKPQSADALLQFAHTLIHTTAGRPSLTPETPMATDKDEADRAERREHAERQMREQERREAMERADRLAAQEHVERLVAERDARRGALFGDLAQFWTILNQGSALSAQTSRDMAVKLSVTVFQAHSIACEKAADRDAIGSTALRAMTLASAPTPADERTVASERFTSDVSPEVAECAQTILRLALSARAAPDVFDAAFVNAQTRLVRLVSATEASTSAARRALEFACIAAVSEFESRKGELTAGAVLGSVADAARSAAVRVAARQSVKLVLTPVEAAAVRLGMTPDEAASMARSRGGTAMVSALAAVVAHGAASRVGEHAPTANAIAEELGTAALTDAGEALLDALGAPLAAVLRQITVPEEPETREPAPALAPPSRAPAVEFSPAAERDPVPVGARSKGRP